MILRYITHPEIALDPDIPVPEWHINKVGVARATAMLAQPWVPAIGRIISSDEVKATDTAHILGRPLGLEIDVRSNIGENDRSATGFVAPDEFELLANAFFAEPHTSVRGWETAADAQGRIVTGLADLFEPPHESAGDIAVIGHGGVGTLLYCHLAGLPIDRAHDQDGGGQYFAYDLNTSTVLHHWRRIDDIEAH